MSNWTISPNESNGNPLSIEVENPNNFYKLEIENAPKIYSNLSQNLKTGISAFVSPKPNDKVLLLYIQMNSNGSTSVTFSGDTIGNVIYNDSETVDYFSAVIDITDPTEPSVVAAKKSKGMLSNPDGGSGGN